jgi:hypothetical protein
MVVPTPERGEYTELAERLIEEIEMATVAEVVLLRKRIDGALAYLDEVVTPNQITLRHIRRHLDGGYDGMPG